MTQNNNGAASTSYGSATPLSINITGCILPQKNNQLPQSGKKNSALVEASALEEKKLTSQRSTKSKSGITEVSKSEPCPHCGKPDWCYSIGELSVCNRDAEPAQGWETTSKRDRDGHTFYALQQANKSLDKRARLRVIPTPTKKYKPAPLPEGEITLAQFPQQPELPAIISKGLNTEITYTYSCDQWVIRTDYYNENGDRTRKIIKPWHINADGKNVNLKGDKPWPIYRLSEVEQFASGKWVLGGEGEKSVEIARLLWLVSITWMGSSWKDIDIEGGLIALKKAKVVGLVYIPDNDDVGMKKAAAIATAAAKIQFPCLILNPLELWDKMPDKGDIYDWVMGNPDWSREEFIEKMNRLIQITATRISQELTDEEFEDFGNDNSDGEDTTDNLAFCQLAFQELYTDMSYIHAGNSLYRWVGNYYQQVSDGSELARIGAWCNAYAVPSYNKKTGKIVNTYPYANNERVSQVFRWVKTNTHKDLGLLNPPGLNCLNGVLQILWDGDKPSWELVPHSPDYYYTYPPLIEYNPKADPKHCDRLLSALDDPQRDILLKVLAASLDLNTVRKFKGRLIKSLLLTGTGSNGKDAIREAIATIYGHQGVTSATLGDFSQYDSGRRFSLSCLANSRINWASENTNTSKLDSIQSLKAAITGNPLTCEAKGKDGVQFIPSAVFLFNINDVPKMSGAMDAIQTRYGIINFNKTFKIGADPRKGELEADPRFAYDPIFLRLMVCPALLNRMLEALMDLMANGIDYFCTQKALEEVQAENSHLFKFAQDTGLTYNPDSYLSATDIWEKLEQWYLDNGTLTYEETNSGKRKSIWADQPALGDRNVKAVNQVLARFKQLFPKAKVGTVPSPRQKRNVSVLRGITFDFDKAILNNENSVAKTEEFTPVAHQFEQQETLINQELRTNRTSFSNSCEEKEKEDVLLSRENTLISTLGEKLEKLVRVDEEPCSTRITGVVTGVVLDADASVIATNSDLLRINSSIDVVPLPEIKVKGVVDNIRELIADIGDWGVFQQYLAPVDENLKMESFKRLSSEERKILKALHPTNDEQRKAKELLNIIKSGQDVELRLNEAIATLSQSEKDSLFHYLPLQYRYVLVNQPTESEDETE
jgi:putative DNA primase/helicase